MAGQWTIPSDHTEEDGQLAVFFCVPNSPQWRGLITAHLYSLEYGRLWNERTGSITEVQKTAREILATMSMCDLERLTVALETLAASVEEINQKTPEQITLGDLIDDLDNNPAMSSLSQFIPLLEFLVVMRDLLPSVALKMDAAPIVTRILDMIWWKGPVLGHLAAMNTSLAAMALGTMGDAAAAFLRTIGTGFENAANLWYQTIKSTGDFMGWWDDLYDWWHGEGEPAPPTSEEKTMLAQVYNDVFVTTGALNVDVNNTVNVDACCAGGGGNVGQPDGEEGGTIPPGSTAPDPTINNRKCKAAQYITDGIMSYLLALDSDPPPSWYDIGQVEAYFDSISSQSPIGWIFETVYNFYNSLAQLVFGSPPNYGTIYTQIQSNYEEFNCAMYLATTASSARTDAIAELTLSSDDQNFLESLMVGDLMNLLYFANTDSEALIDAHPLTIDCTTCDPCQSVWARFGTIVSQGTGTFTVASEYSSGNGWHWARVYFNTEVGDYTSPFCGNPVTVTYMQGNNNLVDLSNNRPYAASNDAGNFVYQNGPYDSTGITNVRYVTFLSRDGQGDGAFEVTVNYT